MYVYNENLWMNKNRKWIIKTTNSSNSNHNNNNSNNDTNISNNNKTNANEIENKTKRKHVDDGYDLDKKEV